MVTRSKGFKLFKIKEGFFNEDLVTPSYSLPYSKDAVIMGLLGSIVAFDHKRKFQWHLHLRLETRFDFLNHNKIREELLLQERMDVEVTSFLTANCNLIKLVSYLKKGFYHYHYYLSSNVLDFSKFEDWFENMKVDNQRAIMFEISGDPCWENVTKTLLKDKRAISSWVEYMSSYGCRS